jgi:uncharacterized protein YjbI with pentapeptide repeats
MKLHRTTEVLDVNDSDISGSNFNNCNLSSSFNQIKFSGGCFNDSNMTGWKINDTNLCGLMLNDVTLSGATVQNANLSGVDFINCHFTGARIDGIPVEDMMAAYKASRLA